MREIQVEAGALDRRLQPREKGTAGIGQWEPPAAAEVVPEDVISEAPVLARRFQKLD